MQKNWKITTMIIGVVGGALMGAGTAYLMIKRNEKDNTTPRMNANQGIQVGMTLLGLIKQIVGLGS